MVEAGERGVAPPRHVLLEARRVTRGPPRFMWDQQTDLARAESMDCAHKDGQWASRIFTLRP